MRGASLSAPRFAADKFGYSLNLGCRFLVLRRIEGLDLPAAFFGIGELGLQACAEAFEFFYTAIAGGFGVRDHLFHTSQRLPQLIRGCRRIFRLAASQ